MTTSSPARWGAHVVMRALTPKPKQVPSNEDTSTAPVNPAPVIPAPAVQSTAATTTPPDKKLFARTPRAMKKCTVPDCESLARSRGRCKAHGGGKRCNELGCELSDQGGGFCIRHGGGRRCKVDGCVKSAQSRHFCKTHGGGVRCKVDGCTKTSQGGGCCRAHGSGPRSKKKKATRERDSINGGGVDSAHAASPSSSTRQRPVSESNEPPSQTKSPLAFRIHAASGPRQASALRKTLPPQFPGNTKSSNSDVAPTPPQLLSASSSVSSVWCRIDGCGSAVPASNASQLCEEHGTNLRFAASLLGMLSTESA